jgi:acetyl esterase/lipase
MTSCAEAQVTWTQLAEIDVPNATRSLSYGGSDVQVIDVFEPAASARGSAVMLIHGGCWLSQYDRKYMSHLAKALADIGSTVYNIGYRRVGDEGGGYPGTFDDVRAAFAAVVADAEQKASLGSEITVVGHSAGGHLALWLASTDTTIDKAVGLAAISDLSDYARGTGSCQTAAPRLMGGSPDDMTAAYASSDPMLIANPKAEIVLISAEKDVIVPPSHNDGYKVKTNARHVVLNGVGHFDLVAPISSVWRDVLSVIVD